jgi:hypothetical protein
MEEEIRNTITELLKGSIQKQLLIPRPSLSYDGTPKPVNQNYSSPTPSPKVVTSQLYNSVDVYFNSGFEQGEPELVVDFQGANYWSVVNYGRKPSLRYPNIKDIRDWVESKPALNYPGLSIDQRTFLVARSIKEHGIYGIGFIQSAYQEIQTDLLDLFGQYGQEYLNNIIKNQILVKWEQPFTKGQGSQRQRTQDKEMTIKLEIL